MPYLHRAEAAAYLGIQPKSLMRRHQRGNIPSLIDDEGRLKFWVPDEPEPEDEPELPPIEPDEASAYEYDEAADMYFFSVPEGMLKVTGERTRHLVDRRTTGQATDNQLSSEFGWRKPAVRAVLRALGVTKDSAPFTDEEVAQTPEEELVASAVRKKAGRVLRRANAQIERQRRDDAMKWRRREASIREVFTDLIGTPPVYPSVDFDGDGELTIVAWHTDTHVGKMAANWDLDSCRRIILGTLEAGLRRAQRHGKIKRILLPVGSDWYDIDTWHRTTTNGTPQDCVLPQHVVRWGALIMRDLIMLASEYAPATVIPIPGNHDRINVHHAGVWLEMLFERHPNVTVVRCENRTYVEHDQNLFLFAHGDGAKPKDYGEIMAHEAREAWGRTAWHWAFHGHLHHYTVLSLRGATVTQLGSLTPRDGYHDLHGYVGIERALHVHAFHDRYGAAGCWPVCVDEDGKIYG